MLTQSCATMQNSLPYNLMHKLPQKSLNQLHQLNASLSAAASFQQQQQQYQQQPCHPHAAHLAPHSHLMQYPAHPQAMGQEHAVQHLGGAQTQHPQSGPSSSAFEPESLRYIHVGNGSTPAQHAGASHTQMGEAPQSTDGGEDWVEQVIFSCQCCLHQAWLCILLVRHTCVL